MSVILLFFSRVVLAETRQKPFRITRAPRRIVSAITNKRQPEHNVLLQANTSTGTKVGKNTFPK